MERLLEASQRAINTLRVVNALSPNAQIQGAMEELEYALNDEIKQQADYAALVQAARNVMPILEITEFYMPGELSENANRVSRDIAALAALLSPEEK